MSTNDETKNHNSESRTANKTTKKGGQITNKKQINNKHRSQKEQLKRPRIGKETKTDTINNSNTENTQSEVLDACSRNFTHELQHNLFTYRIDENNPTNLTPLRKYITMCIMDSDAFDHNFAGILGCTKEEFEKALISVWVHICRICIEDIDKHICQQMNIGYAFGRVYQYTQDRVMLKYVTEETFNGFSIYDYPQYVDLVLECRNKGVYESLIFAINVVSQRILLENYYKAEFAVVNAPKLIKYFPIDFIKENLRCFAWLMEDFGDRHSVQKITGESLKSNNCMATIKVTDFLTKNNPQKLLEKLSERVYGQDHVKKQIVNVVYNHLYRIARPNVDINKRNALLIGPSGSGKTEIARALKDIVPVPVITIDMANVTAEGWHGLGFSSNIEHQEAFLKDSALKDYSIFVLDEIDKCICYENEYYSDSYLSMQGNLLKLLEDGELKDHNGNTILHCKNACFILAGAFSRIFPKNMWDSTNNNDMRFFDSEDLRQMLIKHGVSDEFVNRMSPICMLEKVEGSALIDIQKNMPGSGLNSLKRKYEDMDIKFSIEESALEIAANIATKRGSGVRGMNSIIEEAQMELGFKAMSGEMDEIRVTREDVLRGLNLIGKNNNMVNEDG